MFQTCGISYIYSFMANLNEDIYHLSSAVPPDMISYDDLIRYKRERMQGGRQKVSVLMPACLHGLETGALTEQRQQKLQVCENHWVWRITGIKRVGRRRMNEIGTQFILTGRTVRNRNMWAGNLVRMEE